MKKFLAIFALIALALPVVVAAQQQPNKVAPNIDLMTGINSVINVLFWVLIVVSVVFLVYAGVLFVTAAGEAEKIEQARHIIMYAVIGLIVAFFARGIVTFLERYIGGTV